MFFSKLIATQKLHFWDWDVGHSKIKFKGRNINIMNEMCFARLAADFFCEMSSLLWSFRIPDILLTNIVVFHNMPQYTSNNWI